MVELTCWFECKGRDDEDREVLEKPVTVVLTFKQFPCSSSFGSSVSCKWNTGGHRTRCFASHPGDSHAGQVLCPYVATLGAAPVPPGYL